MVVIVFYVLILSMVNAKWIKEMENINLYQGDIELDPDEKSHGNAYGSIIGGRWPGGVIPYVIDSSLNFNVVETIPRAIAEYEYYTCLRFVNRTTENEYVNFTAGKGCSSPVGYRQGRVNNIKMSIGCYPLGTVMHEIGHTIGLHHEQGRQDRDSYITINWDNIALNILKKQFQKEKNIDSLGTPYDYLSMMHYSATAFGDGKTTIVTKDKAFQDQIGRRFGFSKMDRKQIQQMYNCNRNALPHAAHPPERRDGVHP